MVPIFIVWVRLKGMLARIFSPTSGLRLVCFCLLALVLWTGPQQHLSADTVGGLEFETPTGWHSDPQPMRQANYIIPAVEGDSDNGEVGVYYFGPGQGGGIEANVKRWLGQFVNAARQPLSSADVEREEKTVNGIAVTVIDVTGTYLFKPFPMAPRATPKPGYRMLAAIALGPDAPIFFKLTAPQKTAAHAAAAFGNLIDSLKKQ